MDIQAQVSVAPHAGVFYGLPVPRLVAHRGLATRFPENTLLALHQAVKAGACFIEFDVQFSADGIPVLFHDGTLERTTGETGNIFDRPYSELKTLQACEPERFGTRFINSGIGIPTLSDALYLLKNWPQVQAFVEIKPESLRKFGIEKAAKTLIQVLTPAMNQCIIISSESLAIRCMRAMGARRIGWVVKDWSEDSRSLATGLAPDYLFINYEKLPISINKLWPGPWKWVLYDVNDAELAGYLPFIGADLIETSDVGELLQHPVLRQGGCFDGCAV